MMDPSDKGSESEEVSSKHLDGVSSDESLAKEQNKKTCADCGTTKTPLWRGGPAGPKSLCNACGIRSRKKRSAVLGVNKSNNEDRKIKKSSNNSHFGSGNSNNSKIGDGLKQRLLALGEEVFTQRSPVERQRRKLGEEEQAAVLLMALSCGSVYA